MLTILVVFSIIQTTFAACQQVRGCNGPESYSKLTLTTEATLSSATAPTYVSSKDYAHLAATKAGIDIVRTFLGSVQPTIVASFQGGGVDSDYTDAKEQCGLFTQSYTPNDAGETCAQAVEQAKAGGGQYYLSGQSVCYECGEHDKKAYPAAQVYMIPSTTDTSSNLMYRAIHEYTHAVQKSFGMPIPGWMMEGGAVFMECLMSNRADGTHGGFSQTFSQCFTTGGGRAGVVKNLKRLYEKDPSKKWMTLYGADRMCGSAADGNMLPPNGVPPGLIEGRETGWIYYDAGAYLLAFAVVKANEKFADDGGRSFVDLWTAQGKKGFWHSIEPYELDPMTGWPSEVPEGKGWKKALSEFTGYNSVTDFYAAFEKFMVTNGVVKSEADLSAFLNVGSLTNVKVAELNLVKASFTGYQPRLPSEETCGTQGPTSGGSSSLSPSSFSFSPSSFTTTTDKANEMTVSISVMISLLMFVILNVC